MRLFEIGTKINSEVRLLLISIERGIDISMKNMSDVVK